MCRRLKLQRIDEQLSHLMKTAAGLAGASELTEETRALVSQRVELLALRKRVGRDGPLGAGNKVPAQQFDFAFVKARNCGESAGFAAGQGLFL